MKKLFGRDKVKQQKVTWHSDIDVLIDGGGRLVPVHHKRSTQGYPDGETEVLSEHRVPSRPGGLYYPQFAVPSMSPSGLPFLASIPPAVFAEKKERKSFWDGIIRDRDQDKERETREKEKEREKDKSEDRERLWHEEDNPSELTLMIGYLVATSLEDWALVLEVSDRASATEANAKEATKALRREFKYAEPRSQLSAARLWAIMLRNASGIFLTQISSRKFIDTLEDALTSSRTSPVVRERLMEVLAAVAFITSSRPHPSPFLLNDRDNDRNGFRTLWMRLKPSDKPDVGIPFDTEDAMFSPPIALTRPPVEERPLGEILRQRRVVPPPEEDMKRLFQECKIAKGNATVLTEMLAYAKPEQIEGSLIPEFLTKCRGSQELIYTQIPWASARAERSRNERERNAEGDGRRKSQPDVQFNDIMMESKFYNVDGEEQTLEEELLTALLNASKVLFGALKIYDDVMRVTEERVAVEISRRDVKMDRRHMHDYGGGSSRTPSPMPSPPASPRQHDLPPVVPSQTYPLPRVSPALSPANSHYGSPPQSTSTPKLLAPPPPAPIGPRSPAFPSRPPSPHDLIPVVPSQTHTLHMIPPITSPAHSHDGPPQPYMSTSTRLVLPPSPPPPPPLASTFLMRPSAKVVEEVNDEEHESSDLYCEPRGESIVSDSDKEVHDEVNANTWWLRRQPIQYVYDAVAERTAQHLRERRRPPDISVMSFALDAVGATSSLAVVPTHLPMEKEMLANKLDATIAASDDDRAIDRVIDPYWAGMDLDFSTDTAFAYSSKVNLEKMAWEDALLDAQKVIILNPSSYLGYQLKNAALHGAHRYDEAIETFEIMLSKLDDAPEMQQRELRQQYFSPSEAGDTIRNAIHAQLDDAPLRLLDTTSGLLCDREAQICAFKLSTEYKGLLSLIIKHADIRMERIKEVVAFYFRCVMLSHRWEGKEPLLQDIKDKVVYKLNPVDGIVKLQAFCETARDTGYRWAWIDTCCIDQNNNVELQKSLNSMFIWYRHSALTIVYLSDVVPSSKSGALARSAWNTRGWTLPEFLAPEIVLFYQRDWSLYLDDHSHNHKESFVIMGELEDATGIDAHTLVTFRPGMAGAREKLRWASTRVTTVQEDVAYSLFGVFGVHLPVIYGEKKQNALGRLLKEIVSQSDDITTLDWVGKSSEFNSCLPADITSYTALPSAFPSLSEDYIQSSVSWLQNAAVDIDAALKLYSLLDNLGAPRFANRRLHLPCIAFTITEVRRSRAQDQEGYFAYEVKASGLRDLFITTEDKLAQFSRTKPTLQTFLLVRPWDPYLLELPDFADNPQNMDNWSVRGSMVYDTLSMFSGETGPIDLQSNSRALRLIVRLGQPFGAFLLARQRGGEYRRIASDRNIIAQVKDVAGSVHKMHVRTLEIS